MLADVSGNRYGWVLISLHFHRCRSCNCTCCSLLGQLLGAQDQEPACCVVSLLLLASCSSSWSQFLLARSSTGLPVGHGDPHFSHRGRGEGAAARRCRCGQSRRGLQQWGEELGQGADPAGSAGVAEMGKGGTRWGEGPANTTGDIQHGQELRSAQRLELLCIAGCFHLLLCLGTKNTYKCTLLGTLKQGGRI